MGRQRAVAQTAQTTSCALPRTGPHAVFRLVLFGVLLGLFAMHGLPDARASTAMPLGMADHQLHRSVGSVAVGSLNVVRDTPTATSRAITSNRAAPGGCSLDHTGCVAITRDAHTLTAPGQLLVAPHDPVALRPAPGPRSTVGSRAPPNVSLQALGISRT